ncbi:MAG: porin [Muribaculaceae bacterium]|nr:porin [Muribaculaceae bacterium]
MKKAVLFYSFFFISIISVYASTNEAYTDSLIEKRVTKIEKFVEQHKKILSYLPKVSGYMQIGYTYDDNASNINIKSARVDINGAFAKTFDYRLFVDFASPKILDARIRWKPLKELGVCIGQFKVPFTLGNMYSPLQEECITFPLVVARLAGLNDVCGVKASGRDIGASAFGSLIKLNSGRYLLDYNVGVFNGAGMNLADNNKSKDVAGRIIISPIVGAKLSASYYWGEYGADYAKRTRYSFGASYESKFFSIRGEYVNGTTGTVGSDGYYIAACLNYFKKIRPVFRFDSFTPDIAIGDKEQHYTAGLDYKPFKFLRIMGNYVRQTYTASPSQNLYQLMVIGIF